MSLARGFAALFAAHGWKQDPANPNYFFNVGGRGTSFLVESHRIPKDAILQLGECKGYTQCGPAAHGALGKDRRTCLPNGYYQLSLLNRAGERIDLLIRPHSSDQDYAYDAEVVAAFPP